MELDTELPLKRRHHFIDRNGTGFILDRQEKWLEISHSNGRFHYDFHQISHADIQIQRDDQFLSPLRALVARHLLRGGLGRVLSFTPAGRLIKRLTVALCQRHIIRQISQTITLNDPAQTTYSILFLQGPCLSGSKKVGKALLISGLWLHLFHEIWQQNQIKNQKDKPATDRHIERR